MGSHVMNVMSKEVWISQDTGIGAKNWRMTKTQIGTEAQMTQPVLCEEREHRSMCTKSGEQGPSPPAPAQLLSLFSV